jgi:hypothetical protein
VTRRIHVLIALLITTACSSAAAASPLDEIDAPRRGVFAQGEAQVYGALGRVSKYPDDFLDLYVQPVIGLMGAVGYRFWDRWGLSAYASYGLGGFCGKCTAQLFRGGLEARVSFLPERFADPWATLGGGWEHDVIDAGRGLHLFSGPELRGAFGVSFATSSVALAPCIDGALGTYVVTRTAGALAQGHGSASVHGWLGGGLRMILMP